MAGPGGPVGPGEPPGRERTVRYPEPCPGIIFPSPYPQGYGDTPLLPSEPYGPHGGGAHRPAPRGGPVAVPSHGAVRRRIPEHARAAAPLAMVTAGYSRFPSGGGAVSDTGWFNPRRSDADRYRRYARYGVAGRRRADGPHRARSPTRAGSANLGIQRTPSALGGANRTVRSDPKIVGALGIANPGWTGCKRRGAHPSAHHPRHPDGGRALGDPSARPSPGGPDGSGPDPGASQEQPVRRRGRPGGAGAARPPGAVDGSRPPGRPGDGPRGRSRGRAPAPGAHPGGLTDSGARLHMFSANLARGSFLWSRPLPPPLSPGKKGAEAGFAPYADRPRAGRALPCALPECHAS